MGGGGGSDGEWPVVVGNGGGCWMVVAVGKY